MAAKMILVLCAQALFVQTAFSQCFGRGALAAPGLASGFAGNGLISNGLAGNGLISNGLAGNGFISNGLAGNGLAAYGLSGNGLAGNGLIGNGLAGYGLAIESTATSGGALPVSSSSAIAPVGLSVSSENAYEGALSVAGELPFVSTVGLDGVFPSAGAGVVNHACGNGVVIAADSIAPAYGASYGNAGAYGLAGAYAPAAAAIAPAAAAIAPASLGLGYAGQGCGCGLY